MAMLIELNKQPSFSEVVTEKCSVKEIFCSVKNLFTAFIGNADQNFLNYGLNPIWDEPRGWAGGRGPFPKICHIYSAMMKFGTVISYLN